MFSGRQKPRNFSTRHMTTETKHKHKVTDLFSGLDKKFMTALATVSIHQKTSLCKKDYTKCLRCVVLYQIMAQVSTAGPNLLWVCQVLLFTK